MDPPYSMEPPPLSTMDPRPASPSNAGPYPPGIALQLGPEPRMDVPRPVDIRNVKASCQFGLREYLELQRRRQHSAGASTSGLEPRIMAQANVVLGDLRTLQSEIRGLAKAAENHRWRRWLFGGVM